MNLEASPGNGSSGYISNIEGVFNRFVDVIKMLHREAEDDDIANRCEDLLQKIEMIGSEDGSVELVLLDPMGHSQILHDDANSRDLTDDELSKLQTGPSVPVFNADDL